MVPSRSSTLQALAAFTVQAAMTYGTTAGLARQAGYEMLMVHAGLDI